MPEKFVNNFGILNVDIISGYTPQTEGHDKEANFYSPNPQLQPPQAAAVPSQASSLR